MYEALFDLGYVAEVEVAGKYVDQSWDYINLSQTHECGNWDCVGRAIPRKGTHKWDFLCSAYLTYE